MIKVTFEASSTAALYKAIADFLGPAAEVQPAVSKPAKEPAKKPAKSVAVYPKRGKIAVLPAAAKLAKAQGIDLAAVTGTGAGGKVLKKDVEAHIDQVHTDEIDATKPQESVGEPTVDGARDALKALGESKGIPACMDHLSRYGVKRVSDLLPEQLGKFIEETTAEAQKDE